MRFDKVEQKRQNEVALALGRDASRVPIYFNASKPSQAIKYSFIIRSIALSQTPLSASEIHDILKKDLKSSPTGYLEKEWKREVQLPDIDTLSYDIERLESRGYIIEDIRHRGQNNFGKTVRRFELTEKGRVAARLLGFVRRNYRKFYESERSDCEDCQDLNKVSDYLFRNGLDQLVWLVDAEIDLAILNRKVAITIPVHNIKDSLIPIDEAFLDTRTADVDNAFEALNDEQISSERKSEVFPAVFRLVNSIRKGNLNGSMRDQFKKLLELSKTDPEAKAIFRATRDYMIRDAEKNVEAYRTMFRQYAD